MRRWAIMRPVAVEVEAPLVECLRKVWGVGEWGGEPAGGHDQGMSCGVVEG